MTTSNTIIKLTPFFILIMNLLKKSQLSSVTLSKDMLSTPSGICFILFIFPAWDFPKTVDLICGTSEEIHERPAVCYP